MGSVARIPGLKNETPRIFLYVALDRTTCPPFYTERRIECAEPTKLRRKSGTWGTHHLVQEVLTQPGELVG